MREFSSAEELVRGADPLAAGPPRSACPSGDHLRRGVLGQLTPQDQAEFERHILSCSTCQQQLDQRTRDDTLLRALRNQAGIANSGSHDLDTEAYASLRLTPSVSNPGASAGAVAEFFGNQRFRIDRRLGSGGMGIVYQAYDRERQESIALKTLRRIGEAAAMRLTQEFRALADLRHPNLVSLYELYADGERRFFTMELLDGDDFLTFVRGDSLEGTSAEVRADRLRHVLPQLSAGLNALHAAGKLHRDIKPSNVLVTRNGRLVLVDFGLVVETEPNDETERLVAGTAAYMSPEQAAGRVLSPASDWYSVGVMLFETLTGELPFAGRTREVMVRKQHEEPLPLDYWGRDLPRDLQALCADLLRADPSQRPHGAEIAARCAAGAGAKEDGLPSPSPIDCDGQGRLRFYVFCRCFSFKMLGQLYRRSPR
jgi:serine/threonine protein kinase